MPRDQLHGAGSPLRLSVTTLTDAVLVTADGVVDATNADFLLATMTRAVTPGTDDLISVAAGPAGDRSVRPAVLDLSGVERITEAAVAALVAARDSTARFGVTWRLVGPTEPVRAVLARVDLALPVHLDADSALRADG